MAEHVTSADSQGGRAKLKVLFALSVAEIWGRGLNLKVPCITFCLEVIRGKIFL